MNAEIRLECLRIASAKCLHPQDVVGFAAEFLRFVSEGEIDHSRPDNAGRIPLAELERRYNVRMVGPDDKDDGA